MNKTRIILLAALFCCSSPQSPADSLPDRFLPSDVGLLAAAREKAVGLNEAILATPAQNSDPPVHDPKFNASYGSSVHVYVSENGSFVRRFVVHAPNRDYLAYSHKAARFLALLWECANSRFNTSCRALRKETVQVWLTSDGDPGGEHDRNNLFIYNTMAERTGIEWARELAHEYGHYLLPGASGYVSPESWSNGILGERLYLKWVLDDIRGGKLKPADVPYVGTAELEDYRAKQVAPLIDRMCKSGPDLTLMNGRDRRAMDAFTGLILYIDEIHGGSVLFDILDYMTPYASANATGMDFLRAYTLWSQNAKLRRIKLSAETPTMISLPAGFFNISAEKSDQITLMSSPGLAIERTSDGWTAHAKKTGWYAIDSISGCSLTWSRREDAQTK